MSLGFPQVDSFQEKQGRRIGELLEEVAELKRQLNEAYAWEDAYANRLFKAVDALKLHGMADLAEELTKDLG